MLVVRALDFPGDYTSALLDYQETVDMRALVVLTFPNGGSRI